MRRGFGVVVRPVGGSRSAAPARQRGSSCTWLVPDADLQSVYLSSLQAKHRNGKRHDGKQVESATYVLRWAPDITARGGAARAPRSPAAPRPPQRARPGPKSRAHH